MSTIKAPPKKLKDSNYINSRKAIYGEKGLDSIKKSYSVPKSENESLDNTNSSVKIAPTNSHCLQDLNQLVTPMLSRRKESFNRAVLKHFPKKHDINSKKPQDVNETRNKDFRPKLKEESSARDDDSQKIVTDTECSVRICRKRIARRKKVLNTSKNNVDKHKSLNASDQENDQTLKLEKGSVEKDTGGENQNKNVSISSNINITKSFSCKNCSSFDEKISEIDKKIAMFTEENESLKKYINDLNLKLVEFGNTKIKFEN